MSIELGMPVGRLPYDAYVKISEMPGESSDAAHVGWIEIKQYKHDIDQKVSGSFSASGAPASGQADHSFFWIFKEVDKTSPKLLAACLKGSAVKEINLEVCTQVGDKETFLKLKFGNCIIAAVRSVAAPVPPTAEALAISKPCEWVGIAYSQIEWVYTEMDPETGAKKGEIASKWDRKSNTGG